MARQRGTCRHCGKTRAFFNTELKLCQECDTLLNEGKIQAPSEKIRGRKPELEHHINGNQTSDTDNKSSENHQTNDTNYECEGCGIQVSYGAVKCTKCGIYLDWRGTKLESDPDVLICPECGTNMGLIDSNPTRCPHCGFR